MISDVPWGNYANPLITKNRHSVPFLTYTAKSAKGSHTVVDKLHVGFSPAKRTFTTKWQYSEMFRVYDDALNEFQSYSTNVLVDNTDILYPFLLVYLVPENPIGYWLGSNAASRPPPLMGGRANISDGVTSWSILLSPISQAFNGEVYDSTFYSTGYTTNSMLQVRIGPLPAGGTSALDGTRTFIDPGVTLASMVDPPSIAIGMLRLRTSGTVLQQWRPFNNGASLGTFFHPYWVREGSELSHYDTPLSQPSVISTYPRHELQLVDGDRLFQAPHLQLSLQPGMNVFEVNIHLAPSQKVLLVPSLYALSMPVTRETTGQSFGERLSGHDPVWLASSSNDIRHLMGGPIPDDASFQIIPPLNVVTDPLSAPTGPGWTVPPGSVPRCQTGFTSSIVDYPFLDGADRLYFEFKANQPGSNESEIVNTYSSSRSEDIIADACPRLHVSVYAHEEVL